MVVNPKQLLTVLSEQEQKAVVSIENVINDELTKKFSGWDVCIDISKLNLITPIQWSDLRRPVQLRIMDEYTKEGWHIEEESDQRECAYLRFSYKGE